MTLFPKAESWIFGANIPPSPAVGWAGWEKRIRTRARSTVPVALEQTTASATHSQLPAPIRPVHRW